MHWKLYIGVGLLDNTPKLKTWFLETLVSWTRNLLILRSWFAHLNILSLPMDTMFTLLHYALGLGFILPSWPYLTGPIIGNLVLASLLIVVHTVWCRLFQIGAWQNESV